MTLVLVGRPIFSYAYANDFILGSGGTPTVTGTMPGTPASTDSSLANTITATLNFGEVGVQNTNGQVKIVMPIYLSAKKNYSIFVQRTAISGTSGVQATDIGFGVGNIRAAIAGSTQLTANAVSGVTISGNFGSDPSTAPSDSEGRPQFVATLNNISTVSPTQIFSGPITVANGGGIGDTHTGILADLTFVIVPQMFNTTPSFTTVLTITIA